MMAARKCYSFEALIVHPSDFDVAKESSRGSKAQRPNTEKGIDFWIPGWRSTFLMSEESGVSWHLLIFFWKCQIIQPSGWIEQVQQLVDKLQMIRRLWTGLIWFNHFQSRSGTTGWLPRVDFRCHSPGPLILFHHLVGVFQVHRWVGLSHFRIFSLDLWLVFLVSNFAICFDYPD